MANKKQVKKDEISNLLANFWISIGSSGDKNFKERFNKNLEEYTEKFLKIINKG